MSAIAGREDTATGADHTRRWASVQSTAYASDVLAPLDPDEAGAAVREALATVLRDGTVERDRTTVYEPQLRIEKPRRRDAAPVRLVWVRIRDRDRRVVHEISVRDGSVTEHLVREDASPSFSDTELADGRRLLATEPDLSALLDESDVEIEWFNPGHGRERALGARFVRVRDHEVIESITDAVMDLDDGTVADGGSRDG